MITAALRQYPLPIVYVLQLKVLPFMFLNLKEIFFSNLVLKPRNKI